LDPNKHPKTALTWAPVGRSDGRPKETWQRCARIEKAALSFVSWGEATVAARDRVIMMR